VKIGHLPHIHAIDVIGRKHGDDVPGAALQDVEAAMHCMRGAFEWPGRRAVVRQNHIEFATRRFARRCPHRINVLDQGGGFVLRQQVNRIDPGIDQVAEDEIDDPVVLRKMDGRLRLSITMTGLRPGQAVSLAATATYAASWVCGVAPPPCGELGCGPAAWEQTNGTAETIVTAVAGKAGTATLGISLRVAPPARTCPSNTASPWGTQWEEWKGVSVTDAVRGLRLTPGTIAYGWTA
jgi:hypothetical protein